jgi:hypothetical protein
VKFLLTFLTLGISGLAMFMNPLGVTPHGEGGDSDVSQAPKHSFGQNAIAGLKIATRYAPAAFFGGIAAAFGLGLGGWGMSKIVNRGDNTGNNQGGNDTMTTAEAGRMGGEASRGGGNQGGRGRSST